MISLFTKNLRGSMVILSLLIPVNTFFVQSPIFGIILLVAFLLLAGALIGPAFAPDQTSSTQSAIGVMISICLLAILGSALYYVGPVYQSTFSILILIFGLATTLFSKHTNTVTESKQSIHTPTIAGIIIILLCLSAWWGALFSSVIQHAIRTPWEAIATTSLIAIFLSIFTILLLLKNGQGHSLVIFFTAGVFLSSIAIALTVYPMGFGFDPFIHRASISHISQHGTITPKPLYYIGQYALELIGVHVFSLPLTILDRSLVPILASFFITFSAAISFLSILKKKGLPAIITIFLLPLSAFIVTTPQSLAYIFTIALLFLSLPRLFSNEYKLPLITLGIFTLAALATHPLAGIPALIYFSLLIIFTQKKKKAFTPIFAGIVSTISALSLPLIFILQAKQSGLDINVHLERIFELHRLNLTGFFANRFSPWLDGAYLLIDNMLYLLIAFSIIGVYVIHKYKASKLLHLPLLAAGIFFINYWLLSTTLEFSFLIEYERANYANRLITLVSIFLIPHVGFAIAGIFKTLSNRPRVLSFSFILMLACMTTINVYGAYPRHDNYARSAGFNVSQTDIDAVHAVNEAGAELDYIVLSNQAISAAALQEFGFKTYYQNDIFYYPIPTGGELYQVYLDMTNEDPTRERVFVAMDLAGVDKAFFVVNEYWWESAKIIEHAKLEADEWFAVGNGAVTIFTFDR
jgi:hypothetical protein